MERHVPVCEACTQAARDLDRIGEALRAPREPATPLEHQRARLGLLRRATEPRPGSATVSPSPWRFAVAAAVVTVAVVTGWAGARLTAAPARPLVALHHRPPPRLAPPRETALRPSDDARFDRTRSAGLEVVTLTQGTLDVTVRPLGPGERFVVRTGDAEVEVRGTAFRIEADQGHIRGVAVAEGAVEVRYAGFSAVIPSGGSWRATGDAAASTAAPAAPKADPAATATATAIAAPVAPAPRIAARGPIAPAPRALPEAPAPPPEVAPPEPEKVVPAVAPRGPSAASIAFADAMQALRRGDYAQSAAQLEGFSSAHGKDPRADEAEYLRAIALQRAGRAADAAAAARRYLSTRPRGAHRAEAQRIASESLH